MPESCLLTSPCALRHFPRSLLAHLYPQIHLINKCFVQLVQCHRELRSLSSSSDAMHVAMGSRIKSEQLYTLQAILPQVAALVLSGRGNVEKQIDTYSSHRLQNLKI